MISKRTSGTILFLSQFGILPNFGILEYSRIVKII